MNIFKAIKDSFTFELEDPIIEKGDLLSGPIFPAKHEKKAALNGVAYQYGEGAPVLVDIIMDGESVRTSLKARETFLKNYSAAEHRAVTQFCEKAPTANTETSISQLRDLHDQEDKKRAEATRQVLTLAHANRERVRD